MVKVQLPFHLRNLAQVEGEVEVSVPERVTIRSVLEALESAYPALRGTIRDYGTLRRRPWIRFFACQEDYSFADPESPLPDAVAGGNEPFLIVGAIAGG